MEIESENLERSYNIYQHIYPFMNKEEFKLEKFVY